jgi:hypothetical protein
VKRAAFLLFVCGSFSACEFLDHGPPIHFILPDGFRGEIRIEEGVADSVDPVFERGHYTIRVPSTGLVRIKSKEVFSPWHKERAFSSRGRELPVLSGHAEQPNVIALRSLGMFDDASNHLRPYTMVYVFGTWQDVDNLLNRYHENFMKVTPQPSNHTMEPTASRRTIQLCMSSIHQSAAVRALARGSSSWSR